MVRAEEILKVHPKPKPVNGISGWFMFFMAMSMIGLMLFGIWMGDKIGTGATLTQCREKGYIMIDVYDGDGDGKAVPTKMSCTKSAAEIEADALEARMKLLRVGTAEEYKNDPQR